MFHQEIKKKYVGEIQYEVVRSRKSFHVINHTKVFMTETAESP